MELEERGEVTDVLQTLPPLPEPDVSAMRGQAAIGCVTVCMLIALFVGGAHGGAVLMEGHVRKEVPMLCLALIYAEALMAIGCLFGLLLGDPGVVHRSEETCLPVPPEVTEKLKVGEVAERKANIKDGPRTYCVRCYVWRAPPKSATVDVGRNCSCVVATACGGDGESAFHHCSTCQRCVAHFDHHCGFFGRCIAGRGLEGNMIYFRTIIGAGAAGGATSGGSLVVGLMKQGGSAYWLGVALLAYLGLYCVLSLFSLMCLCCVQGWRWMTVKSPLWLGVSPYKYRKTATGDEPPPGAEAQGQVVHPAVFGAADQP